MHRDPGAGDFGTWDQKTHGMASRISIGPGKLANRGPIGIQESIPGFAIFKKKTGISPGIVVE